MPKVAYHSNVTKSRNFGELSFYKKNIFVFCFNCMFVYIIALHDKNSFDMLDELRSEQDQTSSCGQATFNKHRTATLPVFQPFRLFPVRYIIIISYAPALLTCWWFYGTSCRSFLRWYIFQYRYSRGAGIYANSLKKVYIICIILQWTSVVGSCFYSPARIYANILK